ncbi:MAG: RNase adapter RapZ [Bacteroidales bacterium]|nr:phosphotransferase [Bacteroidales bacterium]MDI9576393.1 RNase adapter RapZ [Bacteroidota bacterium]MDD2592808.1 RNase adapter RapZ [Bacteroidales bacterium]MDD3755441.1 RNase adapter RapZ [Bacteroidales bacterium]MDY0400570.1 RNase adapter RapZ [Bacteroidales bacterium]
MNPLFLISKEATKLGRINSLKPISASGSVRFYAIVYFNDTALLGCYNDNVKENEAFIYFTNFFNNYNLPVPKIVHVNKDKTIYFQTFISDQTIYDKLKYNNYLFDSTIIDYYKQALKLLTNFNKLTNIDFSKTFPRHCFDSRCIRWDLNYFKYNFLKIINIPFDEDKLENDFDLLEKKILSFPQNYLSLRDYQSSNLLIKENKIYVIDYQGARLGSQMYDVASIIFDSKARIPHEIKLELFDYYLDLISIDDNDKTKLKEEFYWLALFRLMQAFGTFGYRGLIQNKPSFTSSIIYGSKNLEIIYKFLNFNDYCQLPIIIENIINKYQSNDNLIGKKILNIKIYSFSIKKHYPPLDMEHGGGFIFDCRCIINPGIIPEMQSLNGKDQLVIQYLKTSEIVQNFLNYTFNTVLLATEEYLAKGYTFMQIGFGCTGGQHRSVFCAEEIARRLKEFFGEKINIYIKHLELE